MGEEAFKRGSTNPRGDEIGSRAAPSKSKENLTWQSRRVIAIEVAVVIVISEGIYLGLPGDLLFPGFRGSQLMKRGLSEDQVELLPDSSTFNFANGQSLRAFGQREVQNLVLL